MNRRKVKYIPVFILFLLVSSCSHRPMHTCATQNLPMSEVVILQINAAWRIEVYVNDDGHISPTFGIGLPWSKLNFIEDQYAPKQFWPPGRYYIPKGEYMVNVRVSDEDGPFSLSFSEAQFRYSFQNGCEYNICCFIMPTSLRDVGVSIEVSGSLPWR